MNTPSPEYIREILAKIGQVLQKIPVQIKKYEELLSHNFKDEEDRKILIAEMETLKKIETAELKEVELVAWGIKLVDFQKKQLQLINVLEKLIIDLEKTQELSKEAIEVDRFTDALSNSIKRELEEMDHTPKKVLK